MCSRLEYCVAMVTISKSVLVLIVKNGVTMITIGENGVISS